MLFDINGTQTIITQEKSTLTELVKKIEVMYPKFKNTNIIVNLSVLQDIKTDELLEFLVLSNTHRSSQKSFVMVTEAVNLDEVPDEILVVPTLQEAQDLIEMEDMERDLGL